MRALLRAGTQHIVCLAALVALHAMPATHASAPITVSGHDAATVIARVQVLVNQARARPRRCGREHFPGTQPLAPSSTLQQAAAGHAMQMARYNFFDHSGLPITCRIPFHCPGSSASMQTCPSLHGSIVAGAPSGMPTPVRLSNLPSCA